MKVFLFTTERKRTSISHLRLQPGIGTIEFDILTLQFILLLAHLPEIFCEELRRLIEQANNILHLKECEMTVHCNYQVFNRQMV